jgi:WD40 repeat protein
MISRSHPKAPGTALRIRSVPDWRLVRTLTFEGPASPLTSVAVTRLVTANVEPGGGSRFRSWPLEGGEPRDLGRLDRLDVTAARGWVAADASARWLSYVDREDRILVVPSDRIGTASARLVERRENVMTLAFSPDAARLASYADNGEIGLHELAGGAPPRVIHGPRPSGAGSNPILGFSPDGSTLVAGWDRFVRLWNLAGPLEAEPVVLRPGERNQTNGAGFEPSGRWLATAGGSAVSIWPLNRRYPRVLKAHDGLVRTLAFDPRGRWLVSGSLDHTVRLWSLREDSGGPSRLLFRDETKSGVVGVDVDADGRRVLVGCQYGDVWVVPVDGGLPRRLPGLERVFKVAFSPHGRHAAASGLVVDNGDPSGFVIHVWDLESGDVRVLHEGDRGGSGERGLFLGIRLQFTHDGRIVSVGQGGVRLWDVEAGTYQVLHATADRFTSNRSSSRVCTGSPDEPTAWSCHDLVSGRSEPLDTTSHSPSPYSVFTLSPDGATLVSSDHLGVVRAGPATGGPPHLLLGHEGPIRDVAVSPDGQWIVSAGDDGTVRLWPMPDVTQPPLHTLPYQELLGRLRGLTNLRVVEDERSPGGYRVHAASFPGWETAPTW